MGNADYWLGAGGWMELAGALALLSPMLLLGMAGEWHGGTGLGEWCERQTTSGPAVPFKGHRELMIYH